MKNESTCEVTVYDDSGLTALCTFSVPKGSVITAKTLSLLPELSKDGAVLDRFEVIPAFSGDAHTGVTVADDCSVFLVRRSLSDDPRVYHLAGNLHFYKKDLWGQKRIAALRFKKAEEGGTFSLEADLKEGDTFKIAAFGENGEWEDDAVLDADCLSSEARAFFAYGGNPYGTGPDISVKKSGRYLLTIRTGFLSCRHGEILSVRLGDPIKKQKTKRKK